MSRLYTFLFKGFCIFILLGLVMSAFCGCDEAADDTSADSSTDTYDYIYNFTEKLSDPEEYVIIGNYKGIEIQRVTVSDADIASYKADIQNSYSYYEADSSKTAVESGDNVKISYIAYLNGEKFDGGSGTDTITVGNGDFSFPEVEAHLVGISVGTTLSVAVTVPEDYFSKGLRGKTLDLNITVQSILKDRKTVPELDADFILENFGLDSEEAFEEYILNELNGQAEDAMMEEAWNKVLDNCEIIEYPEGIIDTFVDAMYDYYTEEAAKYGADAEIFIGDKDEWQESALAYAKNYYKAELVMFSILDREFGREISDSEYESRLAGYATDLSTTEEEISEKYERHELVTSFYWDKVMEVVWDNCIITE